jgi:cytochrome b6-f complex iron-sulfur subunit
VTAVPVEVEQPDQQPESRRRFLDRVWRLLGVVAAAELAAVVAAYLWPRRNGEDSARGVVAAGPVGDFTPASITPFPAGRFYLVRLADGGFLALSSRCTHLGCTVTVDPDRRTFPCPCHASAFDLRGDVIAPPAPRALDLFAVAIEGGVVRVDTRRRIQRSRFEPGQVTSL